MPRSALRPLPTIRQMLAHVHRRLVFLAVLLSGATLMLSGLVTIRGYFEGNLDLVARTIGYSVEPAVVFGDARAMREAISSVAEGHEVRLVELRDPRGQLLARWEAYPGAAAQPSLTERLLRIKPATELVRHAEETIGEVHVTGDTGVLRYYILSGALISLCCLSITFIAARVLARRMEEGVITPLADIASVAHDVRSYRAFDRRVSPSGIAEIDKFGRDFNGLLNELEGWHSTLTQEKDKYEHDATHDALTGLGNRVLFDRCIDQAVSETARTGASFALLYLDANHFKRVNDAHGHLAGDALLAGIAARLSGCIRQEDRAFRLGGDEFAVILSPAADLEMLDVVTARIEEAMAAPIILPSGKTVVPSLSIGAALYPDGGLSSQELLRLADEHMYQDKLRKRSGFTSQGSHA